MSVTIRYRPPRPRVERVEVDTDKDDRFFHLYALGQTTDHPSIHIGECIGSRRNWRLGQSINLPLDYIEDFIEGLRAVLEAEE